MTKELEAMQKVLDDALEKLPPSVYNNSILQRTTQLTEQQIKDIFKVGKEYVERGFMSTTYSQEALLSWLSNSPSHNVLFKVIGKNGKLIEEVSMLPHECELLFKSGTIFIVQSVNKGARHPLNKNKKIIEIVLKEK